MAATPGRDDSTDVAFPPVYEELRRLAHFALRREADGHSLSTTALVHEAYLRLAPQRNAQVRDRSHYLALASIAMRRILVDHARRHAAAKRGRGGRTCSSRSTMRSAGWGRWTRGRRRSWSAASSAASPRTRPPRRWG